MSAVRRGGKSGILEVLWGRLVEIYFRVAVVNSLVNLTLSQRI